MALLSVLTFAPASDSPALQSIWKVLSHHLWFFTGVCCSLVVTMDIVTRNKCFLSLMIAVYISFMWGMWGIKISLEIDNVCLWSNLAHLGYYITHWPADQYVSLNHHLWPMAAISLFFRYFDTANHSTITTAVYASDLLAKVTSPWLGKEMGGLCTLLSTCLWAIVLVQFVVIQIQSYLEQLNYDVLQDLNLHKPGTGFTQGCFCLFSIAVI